VDGLGSPSYKPRALEQAPGEARPGLVDAAFASGESHEHTAAAFTTLLNSGDTAAAV
jgi:hypothetical protein